MSSPTTHNKLNKSHFLHFLIQTHIKMIFCRSFGLDKGQSCEGVNHLPRSPVIENLPFFSACCISFTRRENISAANFHTRSLWPRDFVDDLNPSAVQEIYKNYQTELAFLSAGVIFLAYRHCRRFLVFQVQNWWCLNWHARIAYATERGPVVKRNTSSTNAKRDNKLGLVSHVRAWYDELSRFLWVFCEMLLCVYNQNNPIRSKFRDSPSNSGACLIAIWIVYIFENQLLILSKQPRDSQLAIAASCVQPMVACCN